MMTLISKELCLLLKAYACPVEEARASWLEWLATRSIDKASWAEVRLLAALAGRVALIDPCLQERPLLEGVRRFVWTRNQARLDNSIVVIDLLIKSGIPVMVLKGMARIATNPALASARFVRDIDIMVEASRVEETCDVLIANGWRPVYGKLPGESRAEPFSRLLPEFLDSTTLTQEDFHVDVHRSAIHYGRSGTFDDTLWTRCQDAVLRGRSVKVPSETDQFLHALAHGTVSDVERPVDWVIDLLDAVTGSGFSWEICASELQRRHMGAAIASGLEFLECELGFKVPDYIHDIIKRDSRNPLYKKEVAVYRQLPKDRTNFGKKCLRWAEWLRSRHCLYRTLQQRDTLLKGRKLKKNEMKVADGRCLPISTPITEYKLPGSIKGSDYQLIMDIEVAVGTEPVIRFDLLLNGIWFGRLKIEISQPPENKVLTRRFHITVPHILIEDIEEINLRLILINLKGRVPALMPFHVAVGLSPVGKPVVPHISHTTNYVFSDVLKTINQGQDAYQSKLARNSAIN